MRLVEPTKVCSRCKTRKPYSEFHRVSKDGEARGSRCKQCDREHQREFRARNPERVNAYRRVNYVRVKGDAERYATRLAMGREWKRRVRGTSPDNYRVSRVMRGAPLVRDGGLVDAVPFAGWLRMVLARDGLTVLDLSARLGVSERTLRAVMRGERGSVSVATVERCLIGDDCVSLRELYPGLYGEGLA